VQALARNLQLVLACPPAMLDLEREWTRDQVRIERSWIADLAEFVLIDSPPTSGRCRSPRLQSPMRC